jgi:hypothetical protein
MAGWVAGKFIFVVTFLYFSSHCDVAVWAQSCIALEVLQGQKHGWQGCLLLFCGRR